MKRRITAFLICLIMVIAMPLTAFADTGPKPSVRIEFTGIDGETYYGTLLSKHESTGPASAWDGIDGHQWYKEDDEGYEMWKIFAEYEDSDGFYFLQRWWDCSENNQLNWTYYPPSPFKILLYFPESDSFYVSPIYERYAFDSYFTVDLSDFENSTLTAEKNYDYTWELVSLGARIVITIILELVIALLFGYREKKQLAFLAVTNIITQVTLNVLLNIINYNSGSFAFVFYFVLFELVVFAVEAVAYSLLLGKFSSKEQKRGKAVWYAALANIVSCVIGIWISHLIPGIF